DLLMITSAAELCCDAPAWVEPALRVSPWVVVRRDRSVAGRVPIGIRGAQRWQRHATEVCHDIIAETLSPPDLLDPIGNLPSLPAARALRAAAQALGGSGLRWGPGGSVGFTLATGTCAMTVDSDLDLVFDARQMPPREVLVDVCEALQVLPARVD